MEHLLSDFALIVERSHVLHRTRTINRYRMPKVCHSAEVELELERRYKRCTLIGLTTIVGSRVLTVN